MHSDHEALRSEPRCVTLQSADPAVMEGKGTVQSRHLLRCFSRTCSQLVTILTTWCAYPTTSRVENESQVTLVLGTGSDDARGTMKHSDCAAWRKT